MKYTLISIGDSLSQGFQSFAVEKGMQEYSFPNQVYKYNSSNFTPFKIPNIEHPGFPFNIEYFLNEIQKFADSPKEIQAFAKSILKSSLVTKFPGNARNNNLGIYGYTAKDVLETNYNKSTRLLFKILLFLEMKIPFFKYITPLFIGKTYSSENDKFSCYNIAKITYYVLCGSKKDKNKSQIDIAEAICKQADSDGIECLISYWVGNNDIIGALLSNNKDYISNISQTLSCIEKSLTRLLKYNNTKIVLSTIPEMEHVPFVDKQSHKPIFPLYEVMSNETYNEISNSIKQLNLGIKNIYNSLSPGNPGIKLVEMDKVFEDLCNSGYDVTTTPGGAIHLTSDYIGLDSNGKINKGGLFSLDGAHPTKTAYAIIANEFIKCFNQMGCSLNNVDVNEIASADSLINNPPSIIPEFLDTTSKIRESLNKTNLFGIVQYIVLNQFNMKRS
jgi:hypothetical protein